jgi:D-sedoheptulose 7-phosphate isomerase
MEPGAAERVREIIEAAIAAHGRARDSSRGVVEAAEAIRAALDGGGKLLVFGNGGSAADAQHMASELVGRFQRDRSGLSAIALTTDTSALTSVANDYGFERVFDRQIEALGRRGEGARGISTSGGSANVLRAIVASNERGLVTIALTGRDGGEVGRSAAIHINVAEQSTARIQEVHRTLIHAMCELIEG